MKTDKPTIKDEYFEILEDLNQEQWQLVLNRGWTIKGGWTIFDCISHFVAWEKEAVNQLTNIPRKKACDMSFNDYKKFNKIAVEKYKNYSTKELINNWKKLQNLLEIRIKKLSKEELKEKLLLFDWIDEGRENNHYSYHLPEIKKCLKEYQDKIES